MNRKTHFFIVLILTILTTSCHNYSKSTIDEQSEEPQVKLTFYDRASMKQVPDSLQKADVSYFHDYEVRTRTTKLVKQSLENKFNTIALNSDNFYTDEIINQCDPKIDFFIEWKTAKGYSPLYGFHLRTECPVMYIIERPENNYAVTKKYILNDKKEKIKQVIKEMENY